MDLYSILEVPKDCSQQDINQSFHKKAEIWHPYRIKNNPLGEENVSDIIYLLFFISNN